MLCVFCLILTLWLVGVWILKFSVIISCQQGYILLQFRVHHHIIKCTNCWSKIIFNLQVLYTKTPWIGSLGEGRMSTYSIQNNMINAGLVKKLGVLWSQYSGTLWITDTTGSHISTSVQIDVLIFYRLSVQLERKLALIGCIRCACAVSAGLLARIWYMVT